MAYRPQDKWNGRTNGANLDKGVEDVYTDVDQRDWDEYEKRLTFAINTV